MDNPESIVTNQTLEAENARLRARMRDLESESSDTGSSQRPRRRRNRAVSEETEDNLRDIPGHALDELGRLGQGLSYAVAEGFRSTSDFFTGFADEVSTQRPQRRSRRASSARQGVSLETEPETEPETHVVSNVADDIVAGVSSGVHELLDAPRRVVEGLMDAYREEPRSSITGEGRTRTVEGRSRTVEDRSRIVDDKGRRVRSRVKEEVKEESPNI